MSYQLICRSCGTCFEEDIFRCPKCGGVLECRFDHSDRAHNRHILKHAQSFWDYRELFPLRSNQKVTLGEGTTPLIDAGKLAEYLGIGRVWVKNEGQNPSSTFKDRCLSIGYSKALEMGASAVVIGSAGNAGAAAAAYSVPAGLPCFVLLPEITPMERVVQTVRYGANTIKVRGNVSDCIAMLKKVCEERGWQNMTTAHPCNPFQAEGCKTIAYEMARDLQWRAPDWVIVPIGGGGVLSGIYQGWKDMLELGLVERIPRMVGVQEDGCAPVVEAYRQNARPEEIRRAEKPTGVALAIQDAYPLDGDTALRAIYASDGMAVSVSAREIGEAQGLLGRTAGVFAEPASACTVAALQRLCREGRIGAAEHAVCVITGNGLKDPAFAVAHAGEVPVADMDETSLRKAMEAYL